MPRISRKSPWLFILGPIMDDGKLLLKKAGALLARRAYSRAELHDKLAKFAGGLPVEPVLDRLEQLNLLNDDDLAYTSALYRISQEGWAPAKARNYLVRRQVARRAIDRALEKIRNELGNDPGLSGCIQKYFRSKGIPANPKDVRRLIVHLLGRGYDEDGILNKLKQMLPQALWRQFETGEFID